jgi:hypothetical protein
MPGAHYESLPRFPLAEEATAKPPAPPSAADLLSLAHLAWRGLPGQSVHAGGRKKKTPRGAFLGEEFLQVR